MPQRRATCEKQKHLNRAAYVASLAPAQHSQAQSGRYSGGEELCKGAEDHCVFGRAGISIYLGFVLEFLNGLR